MDKTTATTAPDGRLSISLYVGLALVGVHAALSFALYYNHAYIPDEIWFVEHVQNQLNQGSGFSLVHLLGTENSFGYGALYWILHHVAFYVFDDPWLGIRLVYWLLLVLGNLVFLATALMIDAKRAGVASLFLFTLPMAWWQGKITGPEPLSHVLLLAGIFSAVAIRPPNWRLAQAGIFCGLSIGVKLSTAPLAAFCLAMALWNPRFEQPSWDIRRLVKLGTFFGAAAGVGFVLANPFLVLAPSRFLANLPPSKFPLDGMSARLDDVLFGERWLWEVVPIGSAAQFGASLSVVGLVLLVAFVRRASAPILGAFLVGIVGAVALSLMTPVFFGWYLYSAILLLPLLLVLGPRSNPSVMLLSLVLTVTSACMNSGLIIEMLVNKRDHMAVQSLSREIEEYTATLVRKYSPGLLIDFSEFNLTPVSVGAVPAGAPPAPPPHHIGVTERRKLSSLDFIWNHYTTWKRDAENKVIAAPKIDPYQTLLIIIGDRLTRRKPPLDVALRDWVERSFVNECPGWRLERYDMRNRLHYFVLQNSRPRLETERQP